MSSQNAWRVVYWVLFAVFVATAAANMMGMSAGFLTNHAADVVVPAWLYIVARRLHGQKPSSMALLRWIGSSPEIAAATIFLASAVTEVSQRFWPRGLFAGTFDPLDLVAYGAGVFSLYLAEKLQGRAPQGIEAEVADLQSPTMRE